MDVKELRNENELWNVMKSLIIRKCPPSFVRILCDFVLLTVSLNKYMFTKCLLTVILLLVLFHCWRPLAASDEVYLANTFYAIIPYPGAWFHITISMKGCFLKKEWILLVITMLTVILPSAHFLTIYIDGTLFLFLSSAQFASNNNLFFVCWSLVLIFSFHQDCQIFFLKKTISQKLILK